MGTPTEMDRWVEMTPEKISRHCEVITPETIGQQHLLHLSTNNGIKTFIPQIGHRQNDQEDRTIPRVCVAPSILGCLIGYVAAVDDFMNRVRGEKKEDFKGGMRIYAFAFGHAIRPAPKLVYDAKRSDECWLVTYSPDTTEFKPVHAGDLFYKSITYHSRSDECADIDGTMYLEVKLDDGLLFSKNIHLKKGYWQVEGPVFRQHNAADMTWVKDQEFKATEITKSEYTSQKIASADLLSFAEMPAYAQWSLTN